MFFFKPRFLTLPPSPYPPRQEKEARRAEKAKQRARRARNRVTKRCEASKTIEAEESRTADPQNHRFQWTTSPWLVYSPEREEWAPGSFEQELLEQQVKIGSTNTSQDLVAVSYNVLFDKFDDGLKSDDHTKTPASMVKASAQRWRQLISVLESTDSDLISLQEATPSFIKVLCGTAWVQESYACSASPTSSKTVDPSGGTYEMCLKSQRLTSPQNSTISTFSFVSVVLLLWRRSTMLPVSQELSLFRCSDFGRNRSIAAALRPRSNRTNTVLFAATHLPADRAAVAGSRATDKDCRRLARKRELAAILGEFGRLQSRILELPSAKRERISVTPLVAGDFNSQDDELLDGLFAGHNENRKRGLFRDVWQFAGRGPGWTWDPSRNPRAARSSGLVGGKHNARRIDRVFVGPCVSASSQGSATILEPRFAELVGQASGQEIPPSDHFGVRCAFHTLPKKSMDIVRGSAHSFWAARTPSSPHYMLSLVLDNPRLERLKTENNPESSLPLLHLTLLHGFVEADAGCLDLAKSCVERAIRAASSSSPTPENLFFSWETGLGIFEHRDSTTIVGSPDKGKGGTNWVENLYRALRGIFLQCDEQERHSEAGWQPHGTFATLKLRPDCHEPAHIVFCPSSSLLVTLGVAGSSAAAREIQAGWLRDGSWNNVVEKMAILSVDIFRRGASGKFHSIACFPIISGYNSPTTIDSFLRDAGAATSMEEQQKAAVIVSRIERACRTVTRSSPIDARVQVGGSSKLAAALPGLSDVDAAVLLTPADESSDALWRVREASRGTKFLQSIFESVKVSRGLLLTFLRLLQFKISHFPSRRRKKCPSRKESFVRADKRKAS